MTLTEKLVLVALFGDIADNHRKRVTSLLLRQHNLQHYFEQFTYKPVIVAIERKGMK